MEQRRRMVVLMLAALAGAGALGGISVARARSTRPPAPVTAQMAAHVQTTSGDTAQHGGQTVSEGQQGNSTASVSDSEQESEQATEQEAKDEQESEQATEQEAKEEPGDQNLPGGGHADPEGQDVEHAFEGVE